MMTSPFIQINKKIVNYQQDTTLLFHQLCTSSPSNAQASSEALLLDSAEIGSKNSLKSLLIAKAALKVSCFGQNVQFKALNHNGQAVLQQLDKAIKQGILGHLAENLTEYSTCNAEQFSTLNLTFTTLDAHLDEDSKLQAKTVFDGLRCLLSLYSHADQPIFLGGLFAYDLVANFIPMENITLQDDGLTCPDYCFYLAEQLITIDHQLQQATLQTFCFCTDLTEQLSKEAAKLAEKMNEVIAESPLLPSQNTVQTNLDDQTFKGIIQQLKHHINIGDVFQIVPSRRFSIDCPNTLATYRQLKENNPSPYMFYMQDPDFTLFGASPESALKFNPEDRQLEIYPIAGSRPRGFDENGNIDPELDARLELELRLDHKEQAEHLMLVDLARNDIARVCVSGSRKVAELMQVDRYSHIMHLVSRVVGGLRPELDALHAYQACMNMGTLTGAPKIKAMQLIYQFEKQKRHSYGGAVGYLTADGHFDTCIVIRSAFVQNGVAYVQAGCGEVLDSDPQMEADETRHKARAVLNAIMQTNQRANNLH